MNEFKGKVMWTSRDGRYVVVKGPFPRALLRTLDCKTVELAITRRPDGDLGLMVRGATQREYFAKMLSDHVVSTHNHLGEVSP